MPIMDVSLNKKTPMRCNMYEIGICDDGENTCSLLEKYLLKYAKEKSIHLEIKIWYTGEGLRDYLSNSGHLDILFLDIELYKLSGIELGHFIRYKLDNMGMQLIYISGKSSYAMQLFKTQPLEFLVKPITFEQMTESMNLAIKIIRKKQERFEFQQGKDHYYVSQSDIIYFESQGRKIRLVTTDGIYEFYGRIKDVIKILSNDFMIIHQSYIINKAHVRHYAYETIEMENGDVLTISQNLRKQVRDGILRSR